jgi:hypothetical protein
MHYYLKETLQYQFDQDSTNTALQGLSEVKYHD